jgi:hypothetical protein
VDFRDAKAFKEMGMSMNTVVNTVFDILFRQKYGHLPMIFVEDFENGSDEDLKSQAAKIAWTL